MFFFDNLSFVDFKIKAKTKLEFLARFCNQNNVLHQKPRIYEIYEPVVGLLMLE